MGAPLETGLDGPHGPILHEKPHVDPTPQSRFIRTRKMLLCPHSPEGSQTVAGQRYQGRRSCGSGSADASGNLACKVPLTALLLGNRNASPSSPRQAPPHLHGLGSLLDLEQKQQRAPQAPPGLLDTSPAGTAPRTGQALTRLGRCRTLSLRSRNRHTRGAAGRAQQGRGHGDSAGRVGGGRGREERDVGAAETQRDAERGSAAWKRAGNQRGGMRPGRD